jgi:c-di-GMP-binding flagellar brake protein YcgR
MLPGAKSSERRDSERFSIAREVCYRMVNKRRDNETGNGKTINISSSGVLFASDCLVRIGERVELSISWPVRLDNKHALKLVALGKVVRFEPGRVAMQILQHKFDNPSSPRV